MTTSINDTLAVAHARVENARAKKNALIDQWFKSNSFGFSTDKLKEADDELQAALTAEKTAEAMSKSAIFSGGTQAVSTGIDGMFSAKGSGFAPNYSYSLILAESAEKTAEVGMFENALLNTLNQQLSDASQNTSLPSSSSYTPYASSRSSSSLSIGDQSLSDNTSVNSTSSTVTNTSTTTTSSYNPYSGGSTNWGSSVSDSSYNNPYTAQDSYVPYTNTSTSSSAKDSYVPYSTTPSVTNDSYTPYANTNQGTNQGMAVNYNPYSSDSTSISPYRSDLIDNRTWSPYSNTNEDPVTNVLELFQKTISLASTVLAQAKQMAGQADRYTWKSQAFNDKIGALFGKLFSSFQSTSEAFSSLTSQGIRDVGNKDLMQKMQSVKRIAEGFFNSDDYAKLYMSLNVDFWRDFKALKNQVSRFTTKPYVHRRLPIPHSNVTYTTMP